MLHNLEVGQLLSEGDHHGEMNWEEVCRLGKPIAIPASCQLGQAPLQKVPQELVTQTGLRHLSGSALNADGDYI